MRSVVATACVALSLAAPLFAGDREIPPWTPELERQLQPWCPADCASEVPFTAVYQHRGLTLVFVGVHHVFTPRNTTVSAIDAGFAASAPAVLIAEGFPTAMGESPEPLVQHASRRGTDKEDQFTRSEGMYAISRAIAQRIPFIGGEPSRAEQLQALQACGYGQSDIAFGYLVGGLSQSIRANELTGTQDPRLPESFADWARGFSDQFGLAAMSFEDFGARYRSMFGVELRDDSDVVDRAEPGVGSPLARLNQTTMIIRDEHLLATIGGELRSRRHVLVVYGGSHWTTLATALQRRMGKPKITPYLQ